MQPRRLAATITPGRTCMVAVRGGNTEMEGALSLRGGDEAMGRALGWTLIVLLVVLIGTHPDTVMGLVHNFLSVLRTAGDELSAFVNKL